MCFVAPKDWDLNLTYKNELKFLILFFFCFVFPKMTVYWSKHVAMSDKKHKNSCVDDDWQIPFKELYSLLQYGHR